MKHIATIMDIQLGNEPNQLDSLTHYITVRLDKRKTRLSADNLLSKFNPENNKQR
jgi:hypothetical protein